MPGTARRSAASRVAASSTVVSRVIPAEAGRAGPAAVSLRGVGGVAAARTARSASAMAASTDSGVLKRGGAVPSGVEGVESVADVAVVADELGEVVVEDPPPPVAGPAGVDPPLA